MKIDTKPEEYKGLPIEPRARGNPMFLSLSGKALLEPLQDLR